MATLASVLVITGASSGIGATARLAASRGWRLVLATRTPAPPRADRR